MEKKMRGRKRMANKIREGEKRENEKDNERERNSIMFSPINTKFHTTLLDHLGYIRSQERLVWILITFLHFGLRKFTIWYCPEV